jgi:hypothetical protein
MKQTRNSNIIRSSNSELSIPANLPNAPNLTQKMLGIADYQLGFTKQTDLASQSHFLDPNSQFYSIKWPILKISTQKQR